jgi:hypothetical protein
MAYFFALGVTDQGASFHFTRSRVTVVNPLDRVPNADGVSISPSPRYAGERVGERG